MDSLGKQKALVKKLAQLSEGGSLLWKATIDESSFRADLPRASVQISQFHEFTDMAYSIDILDQDATIVDSFRDVELDENDKSHTYYFLMKNIFLTARRVANGSDKALNMLLEDLENIMPF